MQPSVKQAIRANYGPMSINIVGSPLLKIQYAKTGLCELSVDKAAEHAGQMLNRLGVKNSRALLTGRCGLEATIDYDLRHAITIELVAGKTDSMLLPLAKIVETRRQSFTSPPDKSPMEYFVSMGAATIALPGISREQKLQIAILAPKCVLVIDDTCIEHAGPGSWSTVIASAEVVLLTSSAAMVITAANTVCEAAKVLGQMAGDTSCFILGEGQMLSRSAGESFEINLNDGRHVTGKDIAECAAVLAAALVSGMSAEEATVAVVAAMTTTTDFCSVDELPKQAIDQLDSKVALERQAEPVAKNRLRSLIAPAATLLGFVTASYLMFRSMA